MFRSDRFRCWNSRFLLRNDCFDFRNGHLFFRDCPNKHFLLWCLFCHSEISSCYPKGFHQTLRLEVETKWWETHSSRERHISHNLHGNCLFPQCVCFFVLLCNFCSDSCSLRLGFRRFGLVALFKWNQIILKRNFGLVATASTKVAAAHFWGMHVDFVGCYVIAGCVSAFQVPVFFWWWCVCWGTGTVRRYILAIYFLASMWWQWFGFLKLFLCDGVSKCLAYKLQYRS